MTNQMNLLAQAKSILEWGIKHRRHLHRYPELSCEEQKTAQYCQQILQELGWKITPRWGYGFTADLGMGAKTTIALRADMDALPAQEKNTHEFVSQHPGKAHLCGHDGHMTIALMTARLLTSQSQPLPANVRLIFQPSEELPPGGALGMIEAGCLDEVNEVFGLHNDPRTSVGKVRTRIGALTAAADRFDVIIRGHGCHAARPQDGLDPIIAGAQLICQWQSIISRRINPVNPAVLSVTQFNAGDVFNVIGDTAAMAGTVRTFNAEDRVLIRQLMQSSLDALNSQGYQSEFNYTMGYDAIINHRAGVERVAKAAADILGEKQIDAQTDPESWGEDFCYYLQHKPGAFYFLGSGNPKKNITAPLHSSRFDFDEDALAVGAAVMANIVLQTGMNN